ncbi:hypothetical protein [Aeromonas veronii]|uniref:hypothetical protein n=1 Tax=Aeromonas veronii TaxID=654 RepID=UPI003D1A06FA
MISVQLQPEPVDFDARVRQPGRDWLATHGIALNAPPPVVSDLPNHWTRSNKQLWDAYSGICAYLAIFFEWPTGAASTDHYVAKSTLAGDAYEWSNYRLSTLGPNRNKNKFDDVLDPVGLAPDTFVINFASGEVSPNPALSVADRIAAQATIDRLKLDSEEHRQMRASHFGDYVASDCSLDFLARKSPFVHSEIVRQGLV